MRGRSFVGRRSACLRFARRLACARKRPTKRFEDLSRRAEAALDSHPDEAIQLYKQALAIRPDWPEGWLYMGGALYQKGRYAEAVDALRKGIGLAPIFANGWALLGLSESQLDDPEQALADIRKGEQLGLNGNPQFETAVRVRAAQLLIRSSAFDEALAQLQPLTKIPNALPPVEEAMGLVRAGQPGRHRGDPAEAPRGSGSGGKGRLGFRHASIPTQRRRLTNNCWRNIPPSRACITPMASI